MAEYIDRNVAIEWFRPYGLMEQKLDFWEIKEEMESLKAADVAPVVHAHWKKDPDWEMVACTNCGDEYDCTETGEDEIKKIYLYCPHCGAKMDEVTDDGRIH